MHVFTVVLVSSWITVIKIYIGCVVGHFCHIHQDPDAVAVQAQGRSGEIYRLQIQVLSYISLTFVAGSKSKCQETS